MSYEQHLVFDDSRVLVRDVIHQRLHLLMASRFKEITND